MYVARKPITVLGVHYRARQPVDLDRLSPVLRRRLVEQRRVVPHVSEATAEPTAAPTLNTVGPVAETEVAVTRCGDFGGRMRNGEPCGRITAGLCQHHKGN